MSILDADFYAQPALTVAKRLLGAHLVRQEPGVERIIGRIVETEAYTGIDDLASHGRGKRTKRNLPMWGLPGHAYIYMSRGIHWMLNVVVEPDEHPAAILIRAIEPLVGLDTIAKRRVDRKPLDWVSGPARLAKALNITGALNQVDMTTNIAGLWIETGDHILDEQIRNGPRIGLGKTPEPWFSMPWRYWIAGNPHVSGGSGKLG